jgi:hypothetical protein
MRDHAETIRAARQALRLIERALRAPAPHDYPATASGYRELAAAFPQWIITTGMPGVRAVARLRAALDALERTPAPVTVHLDCPAPEMHVETPAWDHRRKAYLPRRPGPVLAGQLAAALVERFERPARPVELWVGLMQTVPCSRSTAIRAIHAARVAQTIIVDHDNGIRPGPVPPMGMARRESVAMASV